jgi:hypothetical protein
MMMMKQMVVFSINSKKIKCFFLYFNFFFLFFLYQLKLKISRLKKYMNLFFKKIYLNKNYIYFSYFSFILSVN